MRVYLARHGETTWNLEGRYQGRRESALTALGMRQAFALAGAMTELQVGRVITSPLLRCTATGRPAAERLSIRVETDDRLIEIAHGTWEGRIREEIAANDPARYRAWRSDPANVQFEDGETIVQVLERWRNFRASLRLDVPTLLVTHDAVVRVAIVDVAGRSLDAFWNTKVENGAFAVLEATASGWTIVDERSHAHLAGIHAATEGQAL